MTPYVPTHVDAPEDLPPCSIFTPIQFPESVALWHTSSSQQPHSTSAAANTYPSPSSSLNQYPALPPTQDQKKHKRTRSGCFTCRSRRIKCDEVRPVCDRCRKGNRECIYPSPSKTGSRPGAKPKGSRTQSYESDSSPQAEQDDVHVLPPIPDGDEGDEGSESRSVASSSKAHVPKRQSNPPSRGRKPKAAPEVKEDSSPSSTESSKFESLSAHSAGLGHFTPEALGFRVDNRQLPEDLPEDLRFYLAFHQESMNYHHYFQKHESESFVRRGIVDLALQYEPLLYAVVGFAAYHHSMETATGKLSTFLQYYNKALVLLRKSLSSGEKHSEATLITVLVLATFEVRTVRVHSLLAAAYQYQESIGDFVNLIDHHQAAHALVRELLTPESVNASTLHSVIFLWYARFDIVAGLLAGNETVLAREWYVGKETYDAQQAAMYPADVQKQLGWAMSIIRRSGLDMASLYAKLSRGLISTDEFVTENARLGQSMERVEHIVRSYDRSEYTVTSYPNQKPLTGDDIVNPYLPGGLHCGPLWGVNFVWIDYLGTVTMFKYQSHTVLGHPPTSELESLAMEQCRLIETIERWPQRERGCIISFKNSLSMSSLFLPKDEKHTMWCRRKFALMEQNG